MENESLNENNIDGKFWTPLQFADIDSRTMEVLRLFVEEVPNLPAHVHKLLQIVSDQDSDSKEVAKIASSDPAIVSKILKAVNSSYFGLSIKTDDLRFAIVLLGFNEVSKIALQSGFSEMFGENWTYKGYDTRGLWEHSYLVSVCADAIVQLTEPKHSGVILTLGLLHDIGKYALFKLALIMKKKGVTPLKSGHFSPDSTYMEKEEALFGINHPIVGSMLAKKWDLTERICSVLEYHHHPSFWDIDSIPQDYIKDIATISISDLVVNLYISKEQNKIKEQSLPEPPVEFFDIIGLKPPLENVLTDDLREKIDEARKFVTYIQ